MLLTNQFGTNGEPPPLERPQWAWTYTLTDVSYNCPLLFPALTTTERSRVSTCWGQQSNEELWENTRRNRVSIRLKKSCKQATISCELPTNSCEHPTTSCEHPTNSCEHLTNSYMRISGDSRPALPSCLFRMLLTLPSHTPALKERWNLPYSIKPN